MVAKKPAGKKSPAKRKVTPSAAAAGKTTSARSTVSGPSSRAPSAADNDALTQKMEDTEALVSSLPFNPNKPAEYGRAAGTPKKGATATPPSPGVTASTRTETQASPKTGTGKPNLGFNPGNLPLDRVRGDSSDRVLTTNQGVPVADNQHSLKAGLRGPALLEDFILREKLTHFDHERIPERIVHARGSAAHGYFECYAPMGDVTRASLFAEKGKKTPVFVRFSTVLGERGSPDTVRDARGFAVKFYTDEGNWDLVGNNIPVFFIQDAMKFPDLVHAAKPEPHFAMPQASSAHDTFWDFVSLMPESTHMLMWVMSDRAIPRSYRMMEGFGVHTFRLINEQGKSSFVKFHWRPIAGTHSLDWDEAVKICGADADFHRRDLWEAIEAGHFPEWELCFQIFTEKQAERFTFDVLDATKLIPEELVPLTPVGRMVLNRNPDNFFAETEQVAFCTAHIVPGLDFSNDPLLAGRIHSYVDTQISRLGGPNFHEIPINAPIAQVHNNQRDGMHRQTINRGRVAYEPNSLGGGCPFQAGAAGFTSFREPIEADKVRGKPERFAEHYAQAKLFYDSQTPIEQAHILRAFRFELTRVQVPAIRQRVVAMLANVDADFAQALADELGMEMPKPLPRAMPKPPEPEIEVAPSLSLMSHPGDGSIRTRRIAILVADGVDGNAARTLHAGLTKAGAVPRYIGIRLGVVTTDTGEELEVEGTLETIPSVLFDAVAVPGGKAAVITLGNVGHALEFIKDQYRHAKPILALAEGADLVENAGAPAMLPSGEKDPGMLVERKASVTDVLADFIKAIARHRHHEREMDPPAL
ncbi:MAG TPA: catalase [Oligoflexus sp.]|uniref:catalase n=1 Tax=Oligoflexus sp. TaxID=1971216 RepID=UPI002D24F142|nr:catalase [Oligoflexus sp.]HYX38399.1 catalase [Oligoflexus sp.]